MLTEQATGTQPAINDVPTINVRMGAGYLFEGRIVDTGSTDRFWHWGDSPGYKALQVGTKEDGNGIVILTISDGGVEITRPVAELVARQFGWPLDARLDLEELLSSSDYLVTLKQ